MPTAKNKLVHALLASSAIFAGGVQAQENAQAFMARIEAPQAVVDEEFDRYSIEELMEKLHVPGVSIAVVKDFKLHWAKGYGVADKESGRPVDTETRFQAASISKPVTALAAMRLVQAQKLSLDADVNTFLQSWKVPGSAWTCKQAVTPRSLFSHTSGADDGFGFPGYEPNTPLPSAIQILEGQAPSNVGKVNFARAPYAEYKYSGGGLIIMQIAMSDVSHQPFAQLMQASVLTPLDMTRSTYEPQQLVKDAPNTAMAHDELGRRLGAPWHVYPEMAAASLWTTPTDLAKFIVELQTALRGPHGKLLSEQSAREMVTPVGVGPFGVGLMVGKRGEGWYFTHGGNNWGYRAWMIGHLRKGYGYVIMTNGENGSAIIDPLADRIAQAYGWDSVTKPAAK
jgi:CubicO group peptidase (beta-lactamase class C family)